MTVQRHLSHTRKTLLLATYLVALTNVGACMQEGGAEENIVRSTTQAIVGGVSDDTNRYAAVVCVPEESSTANPAAITCHPLTSGFDRCVLRCRVGTLITPRFVLTDRRRMLRAESRGYSQQAQLVGAGPEHGEGVAFGRAPLDGGLDQFTTATCWEQRLSGVAPCCNHPVSWERVEDEPAIRRYVSGAVHAECDVQADCPAQAFCCAADTDPRWADPDFAERAASACGDLDHECGYALESESDPRVDSWLRRGVPLIVHRAAQVNNCIAPLAPDDAPVGELLLLELRANIDDVTPIPLATEFPDGTLNPSFWTDDDPEMTVVGYGRTSTCSDLGPGDGSYRHYAENATSVEPFDQQIRLSNGTTHLSTSVYLEGDGDDPGTAKADWGAPLLWTIGGEERVVGIRTGHNDRFCDSFFATHLSPDVLPNMLRFLDPDGDGIHRGFSDAPAPGYIDRDGDPMCQESCRL